MDEQAQQLLTRLKEANNVLLTVAANPSVDQLAAVIGLTLVLNKQGKHATAVFSGQIPSTIEFLHPEKTLEKNTDSLRDFIIALDKSKADKLRYKVEDKLVKIFITPYKTSISDKDLEFSQGDFNVEVVLALGVADKNDLDKAITAHGRILHDATVATINTKPVSGLGSIHWVDPKASSLCEMVFGLGEQLSPDPLDAQTATAILTGIVAETARFSNEKTSSNTMAASAKLMAAGANQQLVATKLQEKPKPPEPAPIPIAQAKPAPKKEEAEPVKPVEDGALKIDHQEPSTKLPPPSTPLDDDEEAEEALEQIQIDEHGTLVTERDRQAQRDALKTTANSTDEPSKLVMNPPTMGGKLTANSEPEHLDPSTDPLSNKSTESGHKLLSHDSGPASANTQPADSPANTPANQTLQDIEQNVQENMDPTQDQALHNEPELPEAAVDTKPADVGDARSAVEAAMSNADTGQVPPIAALNAQPVDLGLGHDTATPSPTAAEPKLDTSVASDPGLPPGIADSGSASEPSPSPTPAAAPPPVPPPMMPPAMPPTPPPSGASTRSSNDQPLVL